jgi:hypothetical protein
VKSVKKKSTGQLATDIEKNELAKRIQQQAIESAYRSIFG